MRVPLPPAALAGPAPGFLAAELASLRNVVRSWVPYPIGKVHRKTEITPEMLAKMMEQFMLQRTAAVPGAGGASPGN